MLMWDWCHSDRTFWYNCSVLWDKAEQWRDELAPFSQKGRWHDMNPSVSPCRRVNGLFVWRWNGETHRGDHGLIPGRVDDLPLGPVSVTGQHALVIFRNGDLRESRGKGQLRVLPRGNGDKRRRDATCVPLFDGSRKRLSQGWRISEGCRGFWA